MIFLNRGGLVLRGLAEASIVAYVPLTVPRGGGISHEGSGLGALQYDDETERGCIRFAPAFREAAADYREMDDYVFALDALFDWRGH